METQEALRTTVAEFFGTQPERVGSDFPISGPRIQGSMSRALLDAAIRRRTGVKATIVHTARTYGEIEAAILGLPSGTPSATPSASPAVNGHTPAPPQTQPPAANSASIAPGTRCGIDVELIENLPQATDHWEHEFYKANFTRSEIAYCLMQDAPAVHFCGRWCAKEALKKCDAAFLTEDLSRIEVVSHESGAISLRHHAPGGSIDLPHAISLSHTPLVAVAVAVCGVPTASLPRAEPPSTSPAGNPSAPTHTPQRVGGSRRVTLALTLLCIATAGVAVAALIRTFP
ncbi:MAG: 4'-phosphopantetheinyl transferase superfamily protein [Phycisphaerales bacterium]